MKDIKDLYNMKALEAGLEMVAAQTGLNLNTMLLKCILPNIDPEVDMIDDLMQHQEQIEEMLITAIRKKNREVSERSIEIIKKLRGV